MDIFGEGIVYIIDNAQQFWSELEDILNIPNDVTLSQLDATLRRFVSFCAAYHEQYLQSPLQLEHSCDLLLASELLTFHSERMCELLLDDAQASTNPHCQLILYNTLLEYGRRDTAFLRSHKRWHPLLPLLMDHVRLEIDPDIDDPYSGGSSSGGQAGTVRGVAVPIEAKLRLLSVRLVYEVCRVQKLSLQDLRIFDDTFIEYLFELVEQTRSHSDETFNYAVIKLIVALNEQFMVASLQPCTPHVDGKFLPEPSTDQRPEDQNRVLRVLMTRLGSSMTFGENMIFMLNRAGRTPEDLVMQLLVLKILYLLFTTKGTSEYFYTNDLCVLVDVFLREIIDLDEGNESLRHTYLRVLYPLLTKTQLRSMPYKRPQIVQMLESLIEHENIRDINPTTKRLVQRCLSGDWCVQFRKIATPKNKGEFQRRVDSPGLESISSVSSLPTASSSHTILSATVPSEPPGGKIRPLKSTRSAENLKQPPARPPRKERQLGEGLRSGSNDSSVSLPRVATAAAVPPNSRRRDRRGSMDVQTPGSPTQQWRTRIMEDATHVTQEQPQIRIASPLSGSSSDTSDRRLPLVSSLPGSPVSHRRAAPAPPLKRRKPPAIPTSKSNGGATITTIASSASQGSLVSPIPHKGLSYQTIV